MADLGIIHQALVHAEQRCRYHDQDWGRLGYEPNGLPRCDSCKQPFRVVRALEVVEHQNGQVGRLLVGTP